MKIEKIQKEILKVYCSNKEAALAYDCDDKIAVLLENNRIFIIKKSDFLLDYNKLMDTDISHQEQIKEILNNDTDYKFAEITNEAMIFDSCELIKIKNSEKYAWVNRKFLKFFHSEAGYRVSNEKAPVRVTENGKLVGLIYTIGIR